MQRKIEDNRSVVMIRKLSTSRVTIYSNSTMKQETKPQRNTSHLRKDFYIELYKSQKTDTTGKTNRDVNQEY